MADSERIRVEGAAALSRALRQFPAASKKEIRKSNLQVSRKAREWGRAAAGRGSRLESKMAGGIGAGASSKQAYLSVRNTVRSPGATVAFWGARKRTGWYAAERYQDGGRPQHPPWVGNRWQAGARNQGPYVINEMLADRLPQLQRLYWDGQVQVIRRAARAAPGS